MLSATPMKSPAPAFSVVVPVYNEDESLDELVASIETAMAPLGGGHEIVFVDDGSTDGTLETLKRLLRVHPQVRVFSFRSNLGKSPALTCGFQMASGDVVVTMDADLQDDPANIQRMHEHLARERVDVVTGWRRERRDGVLKILSSKLFNLIVVRALFGCSFNDMNSGLKIYKAEVARELQLYGGMHRFIPLIAKEMGYRVAEIPVTHRARKYGATKYHSTKIFTELPDLLTIFFLIRYVRRPLHFFGSIGSALFTLGSVLLIYLTILWARGITISGRPLLSFGVLLVLVGAQVVFTGLLADLIVSVNQDRKQRFPLKYASDRDAPPTG